MRNTEEINPMSKGMDALPVLELLELMHAESLEAFNAVGRALPRISALVERAVETVRSGCRVVYAGAGTSGRMAAVDAAEVRPTFNSEAFGAVMAGGARAFTSAVEGAEDSEEEGARAASSLQPGDLAIGISASGRTPFVLSFLRKAKERGNPAWLICNNEVEYPFLDGVIHVLTGPEMVAGSTRLKAATAQKLCLNMISTATMTGLGKVYDGLMVDVVPSNRKLVARARGIIENLTGAAPEEATKYLELAGMRPKTAVVMLARGLGREEAEAALRANGGSLRGII